MIIRRLRLENFRRHVETDLEFPDGVIALVGANGSGKSTILEAIGFAMYGLPASGTKELIRSTHPDAGDTVRVVLEMEIAGQAVTMERTLRGADHKHEATVTVDGVTLVKPGAGSAGAVTQQITKLLGMDAAAFHTTVVARQKELNRLQAMSAPERKKMVLQMLGIGKVQSAIELGRERAKIAAAQLQGVQESAENVEALMALHSQLTAQQKEWQATESKAKLAAAQFTTSHADAQASFTALQKAQRMHDDAKLAVQGAEALQAEIQAQLPAVQRTLDAAMVAQKTLQELPPDALAKAQQDWSQFEQAKASFDRYEAARRRREELLANHGVEPTFDDAPLRNLRTKLAGINAELQQVKLAAQELRTRHSKLTKLGADAPCPTCEQPLDAHLPRVLNQLDWANQENAAKKENLTTQSRQLEGEIETQEALLQNWQNERAAWRSRQGQLDELVVSACPDPGDPAPLQEALGAAQALHNERIQLTERASAIAPTKQQLRELQKKIATHSDQLSNLQRALAANPDCSRDLELASVQLAQFKSERDDAIAAHREAESKLAIATTQCDEMVTRIGRASEVQKKAQALELVVTQWKQLINRNKGLLEQFRDHLVDRIGPQISIEASRLLALFTGGKYTEILLDDKYEIHVGDEGMAYIVERFSGGEEDVVHLSVRLAISRLLAERAGEAELRFLALDEVFGALDASRRDNVLMAMQGLTQLYRQILVITHVESLQDAFDATWNVVLENGRAIVRS